MDEEKPQSDSLVAPHTTAPSTPKRARADSGSSTSEDSDNRSVRTLSSQDLEYFHEHGRTFGNQRYYMPCVYMPNNDFTEQDRLSLQHQIFLHALKGKLTTTRLLPSTRRILDLGTGPGHWAIAMAAQYPNAEVVGLDMVEWDLDTTEATLGTSRVTWELDDLDVWGRYDEVEDLSAQLELFDFFTETTNRNPITSPGRQKDSSSVEQVHSGATSVESFILHALTQPEPGWHFSDSFEMIHLRVMKGVFANWEEVYAEIYKSLSPGGWIEVADWDMGQVPLPPEPRDPATVPMPTLRKIYLAIMEASFKCGRPLGLYYMHPSYLEEAGFIDIQTTHVNVPIGQWADDEAQRSIGKMMLVFALESFEPSCLRLLTKWGDKTRVWSAEDVRTDIKIAQKEVEEWATRAEKGEVEGWCASFKWITARKSWQAT